MATITLDAEGPGKGGIRPLMVQGPRVTKVISGVVALDSSYPTGGEDISEIFNQFKNCKRVIVDALGTAGSRLFAVDFANKKLKVFTALSTEAANASDQSAIECRFNAIGEQTGD